MTEETKVIQPIVTNERTNTKQNDAIASSWISNRISVTNIEENFMTAITHLDANEPINEEIIDVYATLSRKIIRVLNKSSSSFENKDRDDRNSVLFDYNYFKKALSIVNLNVLESRAMALFNAAMVDEKSNTLSRTELEIALMINDCYPTHSSFHSYYEIFTSFDLDQCGRLNFQQFQECLNAFLLEEGRDPADTAYSAYLFRKTATEGTIDYNTFCKLWCSKFADVKRILGQRGILKQKRPRSTIRRVSRFFSSVWKHFQLRDILRQEMTKPGHDVITQFKGVRQRVVDLRAEVQRDKDKRNRLTKETMKRQKRKGVISASRRKKDMSLILRTEAEKTYAMMEENRMMREKLLMDCEVEKQNMDLMERLKKRAQMNKGMEKIFRSRGDRLILRDSHLDEIPVSLYSDQRSQLQLSNMKVVDLSGNDLVYLPVSNFFFHLISVRKLCLSRNQLVCIPDEISLVQNAEILLIEENCLTKLPSRIKELNSLQVLDLSNNQLESIQDEFGALVNLRVLKLHSNQITKISRDIGNLKHLHSIDFSNNKMRHLPDSFCSLDHLVSANLSHNYLSDLPMQFGSLVHLEDLDISYNNIKELPDSMSSLKELKIINVNQNSIDVLGNYLEGLTHLTSFEGMKNNINNISTKLGMLHSLNRLSISVNQIKTLPIELGLLRSLVYLNLHNNLICELPVEIGALDRLQSLDMSHNMITRLPHELCLAKSLIWIDLSSNGLTCLPKHFGSLKNLRILKLAKNKLKAVPETFKFLTKIEELDLSSNFLHEIDIGLCEGLVSLRVANFESNRIKYLPQKICSMPLLELLNLRHNNLDSIPLDITDSHIKIDLTQNPLSDLPFKFSSIQNARSLSGYSEEEVINFMVQEEIFYKPAVDEWEIKKPSYIEGKLKFSDFMNGVVWRYENMYKGIEVNSLKGGDPHLLKRLKQFYFYCKKYGNPPLYTYRNDKGNKVRKDEANMLMQHQNDRLEIARNIDYKRRLEEFNIYFGRLDERCSDAGDKFKQVREDKARNKQEQTKKLLDEVTNILNVKLEIEEERNQREKLALAQENKMLNKVSFQSHHNKKRFLPVELKPCWKSDSHSE